MKELIVIGRNIAQIRKERGLTQEAVCGEAEIERTYLSRLENGSENVSIKTLLKIAKALDVKISVIIGDM